MISEPNEESDAGEDFSLMLKLKIFIFIRSLVLYWLGAYQANSRRDIWSSLSGNMGKEKRFVALKKIDAVYAIKNLNCEWEVTCLSTVNHPFCMAVLWNLST